jgi:hypothetical protein
MIGSIPKERREETFLAERVVPKTLVFCEIKVVASLVPIQPQPIINTESNSADFIKNSQKSELLVNCT